MPAKRAYGMDQDFYPWSPIVTRPVLRWPDNARVAAMLRRRWPQGAPRYDDGTLVWELPLRAENVLGDT